MTTFAGVLALPPLALGIGQGLSMLKPLDSDCLRSRLTAAARFNLLSCSLRSFATGHVDNKKIAKRFSYW